MKNLLLMLGVAFCFVLEIREVGYAQAFHPQKSYIAKVLRDFQLQTSNELDLTNKQAKQLQQFMQKKPFVREFTKAENIKRKALERRFAEKPNIEKLKAISRFMDKLFLRELKSDLSGILLMNQLERFEQLYMRRKVDASYKNDFHLPKKMSEELKLSEKEKDQLRDAAMDTTLAFAKFKLELRRKIRNELINSLPKEKRKAFKEQVGRLVDMHEIQNEISGSSLDCPN